MRRRSQTPGLPMISTEIGPVQPRPPSRLPSEEIFPEGEGIVATGDAHADMVDARSDRAGLNQMLLRPLSASRYDVILAKRESSAVRARPSLDARFRG